MSRTQIGSCVLSICLALGLGGVPVADAAPSGPASHGPKATTDAGISFMLDSDGRLVRSFTEEQAARVAEELSREGDNARLIDVLYDSLEDADFPQSEGAQSYCLTVERNGKKVHMDLSRGSIKLTDLNTGERYVRFNRQDAKTIEARLKAEGWDQKSIMKVLFGQRHVPTGGSIAPARPGGFSIGPITHDPNGGFSGPLTKPAPRMEPGPYQIACDTCIDGSLYFLCNYCDPDPYAPLCCEEACGGSGGNCSWCRFCY